MCAAELHWCCSVLVSRETGLVSVTASLPRTAVHSGIGGSRSRRTGHFGAVDGCSYHYGIESSRDETVRVDSAIVVGGDRDPASISPAIAQLSLPRIATGGSRATRRRVDADLAVDFGAHPPGEPPAPHGVPSRRRSPSARTELGHGTRTASGRVVPGSPRRRRRAPLLSRRIIATAAAAVETVRMSGDRDRSTFYTPGPRFEDDVP